MALWAACNPWAAGCVPVVYIDFTTECVLYGSMGAPIEGFQLLKTPLSPYNSYFLKALLTCSAKCDAFKRYSRTQLATSLRPT